MQLLHADAFHSPTWFLDCCTATSHPNHRLLLTNYDLGAPVPAKELQLVKSSSLPVHSKSLTPNIFWAKSLHGL
jgi:hypothetical protein